nr:hypothetical protein Iba_chr02bCG7980 [Ipomoea batatas]
MHHTTRDINKTKINQEEEPIDYRCIKEAINHQGMKHLGKVLRTKWSGRELPEPILKKSTNSKSPIEEVTVEEVLEEEEAKEKGDSPLPTSPKVTQALRKQKTKRMCLYDTCYFVDIFHEHVESVYSNFLGKVKNDTHLKELCDDVDIESLALVDNSLTRKHDSDMHEILCIDDETNVDGIRGRYLRRPLGRASRAASNHKASETRGRYIGRRLGRASKRRDRTLDAILGFLKANLLLVS